MLSAREAARATRMCFAAAKGCAWIVVVIRLNRVNYIPVMTCSCCVVFNLLNASSMRDTKCSIAATLVRQLLGDRLRGWDSARSFICTKLLGVGSWHLSHEASGIA